MPQTIARGLEIVPGYTLVRRLGSGMAGEVWIARASGGVHVAIKLIRDLQLIGSRRELGALRIVREVKHPNLCPLIGVWFFDADGELLTGDETDDILGRESSLVDTACLQTMDPGKTPIADGETQAFGGPAAADDEAARDTDREQAPDATSIAPGSIHDSSGFRTGNTGSGFRSVGSGMRGSGSSSAVPGDHDPIKAAQMVIAMGLGEKTLHDRLVEMRAPGNQPQDGVPFIDQIPGGIPTDELMRYIIASGSAIDELNEHYNIYHCDIKPQNILIVGGQAQVCDFGLARQVQDSRKTQLAIGTPAYGAPEMIFDHTYSETIDQYSLAVTYYELRTGQLPFETTRRSSFLRLKASGELDLSHVSTAERDVLARATDLDPKARFASCAAFTDALSAAIEAARRPERTLVPSRSILLSAGCVGVLTASLAVAFAFRPSSDRVEVSLPDDVIQGGEPAKVASDGSTKSLDAVENERVVPGNEVIGPVEPDPIIDPQPPATSTLVNRDEPPIQKQPTLAPVRLNWQLADGLSPHQRLAILNEAFQAWLSAPRRTFDFSEMQLALAAIDDALPIPQQKPFPLMTEPERNTIRPNVGTSLAAELHDLLDQLPSIAGSSKLNSSEREALLAHLATTRLHALWTLPNVESSAGEVELRVNQLRDLVVESDPFPDAERIPMAATLVALSAASRVPRQQEQWASLDEDYSRAEAFTADRPEVRDLLHRSGAELVVRLEEQRSEVSRQDPQAASILASISESFINRLPGTRGRPAADWELIGINEPTATKVRVAAGNVAWDQGASEDAITHWLAASRQMPSLEQVDLSQRRSVVGHLLDWVRSQSGVDDSAIDTLRYANASIASRGVLDLAFEFVPSNDSMWPRIQRERFIMQVANADWQEATATWRELSLVASSLPPQLAAAAYRLSEHQFSAAQRESEKAKWASVMLGSVTAQASAVTTLTDPSMSFEAVESFWAQVILPSLSALREVTVVSQDERPRVNRSVLSTHVGEFGRLVLPRLMSSTVRDARADYVGWLSDIELVSSLLADRADDPDASMSFLAIAFDAFLQQQYESRTDVDPADLLVGLNRYCPDANLIEEVGEQSPILNYVLGRFQGEQGIHANTLAEKTEFFGAAKSAYERAIESPSVRKDLLGEVKRCRADLLVRVVMLQTDSDLRRKLLEMALDDSRQAIGLPTRWYYDIDQRLGTSVNVIWKQMVLSPRMTYIHRKDLLAQYDDLQTQAIATRRRWDLDTLALQLGLLDGYWWDMLGSFSIDKTRFLEKRDEALRLVAELQASEPITIGDRVILDSVDTQSSRIRCRWHRCVARINAALGRLDDAIEHFEVANYIARVKLAEIDDLVAKTTIELVTFQSQRPTPNPVEMQKNLDEWIGKLEALDSEMPEVLQNRDRLLSVLQNL
ncbi:MAG: protein kinase [Planctomycetota bacterium]